MKNFCNRYSIDYDLIANFLVKNRIKKVLIEAPDGLKPLIPCIIKKFGDKYKFLISGSPTYGSCDIALNTARELGVDAIIHVGHNEYPFLKIKIMIPILYVPAYYNWKPSIRILGILNSIFEKNSYQRIGLVATIQHMNIMENIKKELESRGYKVFIGKSASKLLSGQILGCEFSAAINIASKVDVFLLLAGGRFHAIGLSLVIKKPVIQLDPYREEIIDIRNEVKKILMKRYYIISRVRNNIVKTAGIIIGSKPGQYRPHIVDFVKKILTELGIDFSEIVVNELSFEKLVSIDNALNLDIYIVTSCPRLPIDDLADFYKPVLTPGELYMVKNKEIKQYIFPMVW